MRAKILSSTSTFNGVSYNTKKTHTSKGELMKYKNFGYIQSSNNVTPDEMKAYLKAHSSRNTRVKAKQFHAMISCKGREYPKEELTKIAEEWLHKMGYGENPYLIVFHSDTNNNHVHMVSTRIGNDGKKIKDNMERIKAQIFINEIMKKDPKQACRQIISDLKAYSFSTAHQAKLFLETRGYGLKEDQEKLKIFKFGLLQGEILLKDIENKVDSYFPDRRRIKQLNAVFDKYRRLYNSEPYPVFEPLKGNKSGKQVGYRSEMSDYLKEKFGIEIIFHGREGKKPYGYSIIDHSGKYICKGSEIYPLKELIRGGTEERVNEINISHGSDKVAYENISGRIDPVIRYSGFPNKSEYRLKLLSVLEEYATVSLGLNAFKLEILEYNKKLYLLDPENKTFINLESLLKAKEYNRFALLLNASPIDEQRDLNGFHWNKETGFSEHKDTSDDLRGSYSDLLEQESLQVDPSPNMSLSIKGDVDDERAHGRERRKNRKAHRKNTR